MCGAADHDPPYACEYLYVEDEASAFPSMGPLWAVPLLNPPPLGPPVVAQVSPCVQEMISSVRVQASGAALDVHIRQDCGCTFRTLQQAERALWRRRLPFDWGAKLHSGISRCRNLQLGM